MWDEPVTTADLLEKWREATRAAELARRLAEMAERAQADADERAASSEEIAQMAEQTARAAEAAAATARKAADRAAAAAGSGSDDVLAARETATARNTDEEQARSAYHDAEDDARQRHEADVAN